MIRNSHAAKDHGGTATTYSNVNAKSTSSIAKRKKSRRPRHVFGWKKVHAEEVDPAKDKNNDNTSTKQDHDRELKNNHYDNPSLEKLAGKELESSPQEAAGIFFGLEVLDGDSYRIEQDPETNQKVMVPVPQASSGPAPNEDYDKKRKSVEEGGNDVSEKPAKKKKKKKKKKKQSEATDNEKETEESNKGESSTSTVDNDDETGEENMIQSLQTSWSAQTGGMTLHSDLCASLVKQQFWSPTPIQAAALAPAILGRRNIVGAAPTGSGKTLAFLLPIGQHLLEESAKQQQQQQALQALILTPTRELAMQILDESDKLLGIGKAGALVGGLAHVKQVRVLQKKRPPILVATPGRLWEMMSSREHAHLNDLSQIRFLVIDEADRMVQQGSFPQLSSILDAVQKANPMDDDDDSEGGLDDDEADEDRLLGLPGVPGEAKLVMLNDDVLAEIDRQRGSNRPSSRELDDGEFEEEEYQQLEEARDEEEESQISLPGDPPVVRQTFVYSATLTLPASANFSKSKSRKRKRFEADVDGAIAEILEKSRAKGKTKVLDLSNTNKKASPQVNPSAADKPQDAVAQDTKPPSAKRDTFRLPDGLTLQHIKCTQRHKDSHLYAYLMTTAEGASGPCLVFCNSIAGARRVGATLQALGLDARILHAQMQQRARFKAVELLRDSEKRTVVVATDVAARGLDIPSVASVVHYDTARTVDSFVHRSGRTARGVGPKAVGFSVSLVSSDEDKMHSNLVKALNVRFAMVSMDGRLLQEAQERVNLASKVVEVDNIERKSQRQNQWVQAKAEDAGLEVDESMLDEGLSGGATRDKAKLKEAHRARERLAMLLSQPMKTQRFGKFLSTNSSLKQSIASDTPNNQVHSKRHSKKRRRRR